jgi:hypothetical protein
MLVAGKTVCIFLVIAASLVLPGCAAGIIGVVAAFASLSGSGGGGDAPDLPPVVAILGTRRLAGGEGGSRLLVELRYAVTNETGDEGQLAVSVEVVRVRTGGTDLDPVEAASSFEGCDPLDNVPPGEERCFLWNVRENFRGAGEVGDTQFIVTATEDDRRQSDPQRSSVVFAGNTPVAVSAARLVGPGPRVDVFFLVADAEGDRARRRGVEVSAAGGKWVALPAELLAALPSDFAAAPEPGLPATFFFAVGRLEGVAGLEALARPGFFGEVRVRFTVEDFPDEGEATGVAAGNVDTNEAPLVEIVSVGLEEPQSGVVPIRYRLVDRETHPATVFVEVDLGDARGLRPALELPLVASEGVRGLCSLDPGAPSAPGTCAGPAGTRAHGFLWDFLAEAGQGLGTPTAILSIAAQDAERGSSTNQFPGPLIVRFGPSRVRDEAVGDRPIALAAADFDADGFTDLAVANQGSNNVTLLRGAVAGLVRVREEPAGTGPIAFACADFDGDGFPDLAVANESSDNITYLRGGSNGLVRVGEVPARDSPTALAAADFDGDHFPDLAVANESSDNITYLHGGPAGLVRVREEMAGTGPIALAAVDFDADGFTDLAVANQRSDNVTFLSGGIAGLTHVRDETAGTGPIALACADFDGDDFPDLAVANEFSDSITYLRGGPAGIVRERDEATGNRPTALAAADFDADGFTDLAVANEGSDNVTLLSGGIAGLTHVRDEATGNQPTALAAVDFDGDGFADLTVANQSSCRRGGTLKP